MVAVNTKVVNTEVASIGVVSTEAGNMAVIIEGMVEGMGEGVVVDVAAFRKLDLIFLILNMVKQKTATKIEEAIGEVGLEAGLEGVGAAADSEVDSVVVDMVVGDITAVGTMQDNIVAVGKYLAELVAQ